MRRLIALTALLLAFPAAQLRAGDTPQSLTLTAPGATTFSHQIDFRGRLLPAEPGVRVRLLRGANSVGFANAIVDHDGIARRAQVVARGDGRLLPSLPLDQSAQIFAALWAAVNVSDGVALRKVPNRWTILSL